MGKNLLIYVFIIVSFGFGIYSILERGSRLPLQALPPAQSAGPAGQGTASSQPQATQVQITSTGDELIVSLQQPLSLLLLQIIVIIAAARGLGYLFARISQPAVIGEMLAGILLGPSLLGWMAPRTESFLFPASSFGTLQLLSQIGVILFMFIVGMELNVRFLRKRARTAVLVSHAGILAPFILGTALSLLLYRSLAPQGVSFRAFALFMGIAMSITAFPVLSRILEQRGMSETPLGSTAIACAAVDDVTAWCLLALVLAIARAESLAGAIRTVGLALFFIAVMIFLIRPKIHQIIKRAGHKEATGNGLIAGMLIFAFASALFTETIGIHALFGAFLAGVVLPPQLVTRVRVKERLETFNMVFLLPLFFAFTGLRTQINLLDDRWSWFLCACIIMAAIAGKLAGTALAARSTGMSWYDSLSIGALMNTRGLMELIALNIGFDLGILSAKAFAMMVLMALITTTMAGPILSLLESRKQKMELVKAETTAKT